MDPFTHALSGALIARATEPKEQAAGQLSLHARTIAGALAAMFPDIDIVERLFGDSLSYLNTHRGITHSLLLWPLWAWLLAHMLSIATVGRYSWRAFFGICLMGIAAHIAGDLLTSYGTMIFAPVSDWRVSLPAMFIFDPWLTLLFGIFLWLSRGLRVRQAARAGLILAGIYLAVLVELHYWSLDIVRQQASLHGWKDAEIAALPQPFSPFRQKLIVSQQETYHIALIDLAGSQLSTAETGEEGLLKRILHAYRPPDSIAWQTRSRFGGDTRSYSFAWTAWSQPELEGFRRFAVSPALDEVIASGDEVCAFFVDLRFTVPGLKPPFRYGACHSPTGWRLSEPSGSTFPEAARSGS